MSRKTKSLGKSEAEVCVVDGLLCVVRAGGDVRVAIVGPSTESELVLSHVLDGFFSALAGILHGQLERRVILDNLELVMLLIDELADGGRILETDAASLMSRVLMREPGEDPAAGGGQAIGELTIGQALKQAREQLVSNLSQQGM
ncbi:hypothetical protein TeGR_g7801 [Tetraparma gracilis]|uniref:Coatomer subunit zeta n=1 Tax=Tetraparma gracilis TaxID=2962635 RepID=A0ABQ6MMP6_9STRA|nr:hypothetical protein TeGR_g7801 [Tetraparma gracilis]